MDAQSDSGDAASTSAYLASNQLVALKEVKQHLNERAEGDRALVTVPPVPSLRVRPRAGGLLVVTDLVRELRSL